MSEIVGHKTFSIGDGTFRHEPITREEADAIWNAAKQQEQKRAEDMPTEQDAIRQMRDAHQRLKELGWRDAIYCPKDGSVFEVLEAGSSGIHDCFYTGKWPDGTWWIPAEGDLWPSRPILFRPKSSVQREEQNNG